VRRSRADHTVDSPIPCGKGGQTLAELPRRVEERVVQLTRDPEELVLVLVADADGHGHRDDAAVQAGPVGIEKLLVGRDMQYQPVTRLCARALQVMEDAERAPPQLRQTQRFLGAFAFEITDRAVAAAAMLQHLGKCLVSDHPS
jgi:hypothetical protein